ncbi:MAG: hypothetical protein AABY22_32900, partial [Nanoarchaeota archaeon]
MITHITETKRLIAELNKEFPYLNIKEKPEYKKTLNTAYSYNFLSFNWKERKLKVKEGKPKMFFIGLNSGIWTPGVGDGKEPSI